MKTFDKKDVYSWGNAEDAKQYIGKQGYFADSLKELHECVNNDDFYTLFSIDFDSNTDVDSIFSITNIDYRYALFLPEEKVKEVEEPKKYRPFKSIDEFKKETRLDLLSIVHYRYIVEKPKTMTTIGFGVITDFCTCSDKTYYITIGDTSFNLDELFNYEYLDNNDKWKPFGVEE